MSSLPQVLHRPALPITVPEFVDAVQAVCPPRYPASRGRKLRPVGLAISGGVDSMALAFLCHKARRWEWVLRVADNPVSIFQGYVVDHGAREGSAEEADGVRRYVESTLGIRTSVLRLSWDSELGHEYARPMDLPNFEAAARRLRYRKMAQEAASARIGSLFVAHHADDQYETVLMRLIKGHGARGLLGMAPAADIPESHDIHGVWRSGLVDDQMGLDPQINFRPTTLQRRFLRENMLADIDPEVFKQELEAGQRVDAYLDDSADSRIKRANWLPRLPSLDVEDGGVKLYRPLLEFSKDRLIATCEENGIAWWEDATNHDRTLTMRNAVRHMARNYNLPVALQKPSIIELSRRCREREASDEREVDRLLGRTIVRDFDSVVGTVVVRWPTFQIPRPRPGPRGKARRQGRLAHYRHVAALLIRRLLAVVSPEHEVTPPSLLQQAVLQLFPTLNDKPSAYPAHPKAFNICRVHMLPVRMSTSGQLHWYLSREPYQSNLPRPSVFFNHLHFKYRWRRLPERWRWSRWSQFKLWDGRFWIRVKSRLPVRVVAMPFMLQDAKAIRGALVSKRERDTFDALLKQHAPGKVRWTLPALYTTGDYEQALRDHRSGKGPSADIEEGDETELVREWQKIGYPAQKRVAQAVWLWEKERIDHSVLRLVALPSLCIHKPGLENWLQYVIRYRGVDRKTLHDTLDDEGQLAWINSTRSLASGRRCSKQGSRLASSRRSSPGRR